MRNVSQATQNAWDEFGYTTKRIYIQELEESIPDINITNITLKESISDSEALFFVGCIASQVNIELNNFTTDILGNTIEIYVEKGDTDEIKIFTGKINSFEIDERTQAAKIIAYDALYEAFNTDLTAWYDGLNLPMSMASFRIALFNELGITQNAATLINDNMLVERTIGGDGILGADLIKPLCEANAVFGKIDQNGNMNYLFVGSDVRSSSISEVSDFIKEKFETALIDKVIIRTDEADIGAITGSGSNAYIIEGNMYFLGLGAADLETIAETILGALDSVQYRPYEVTEQYNPIYEMGDLISIPDGLGNTYTSIILSRTTNLQSETLTAKGLEEYSQAASYSNDSLIALRGKTNRLYRSVEETRSEISDVEAGLRTEIRQTAEGIEIQIQDLQDQIDGTIEYYERDGAPTLLNYPYWDFTSAFKCDGTKKCAAIYDTAMVEGGDQYPHFYYSEADRKAHQRDLCFDNTNAVSYRFNYVDGQWIWQEIADSETSVILSRLSSLEATAEELQSEYSEISLDLSGNYYTKVQTDSRISQTASQIQTTVSQTYATKTTTNSLQTQITQNATAITAKASTSAGTAASFAYELTANKFELKANNKTVLICDSNGLKVDGNILSTSVISGATIQGATITGGRISGTVISGVQIDGSWTTAANSQCNFLKALNIETSSLRVGYRETRWRSFSTDRIPVVTRFTKKYSSVLGGYYIEDVQAEYIDYIKNPGVTALDYLSY